MTDGSDNLAGNKTDFQKRLVDWYDSQARDLPWRSQPSLYKTVVSEFMLQQTQVKTVLPYFHRWLENYPDFESLANASEQSVLKSWEGLGYYSRARNLHKLAQEITLLTKIPKEAGNWLKFPGIGPYAAAAICSIAFNDPTAVVDGNVVRILARLTADLKTYKNSGEAAKKYRALATALLNEDRPGDHNQAMMELGATLCLKQNPQCLLCPVSEYCEGRIKGIEKELPKFDKTKYESRTVNRAWISGSKGALLYKIPQDAKRMKGLYEIPSLEQLGFSLNGEKPILERKRSITKYRITESFFTYDEKKLNGKLPANCQWVALSDLEALPFSGPHRRWIEELLSL